jgi:hypothetical protein
MGMTAEHVAPGIGERAAWLAGEVLGIELRRSLREMNARFLDCLKRMPDEELSYLGFAPAVSRLLRSSETEATLIMAACPYALFDVAFRRHDFWQAIFDAARVRQNSQEGMVASPPSTDYLLEYDSLTELVLFFAWHLATTNALATRLVLGMSSATAELIRSSALPSLAAVVRVRRRLLRPRWPQRTLFWRRLLAITPKSSAEETTTAQLIGIQLMATEEALEQLPAAAAAKRR